VEVPTLQQFDIKEFVHEKSSFEKENQTKLRYIFTLVSSVWCYFFTVVVSIVLQLLHSHRLYLFTSFTLVSSVVFQLFRYKLIGMIRHCGSLQSGHYVSYCKLKGTDKKMQARYPLVSSVFLHFFRSIRV
jgi:hypothetical protein